jgi:transglutaminase-like putative cysteine protease
MQSASLSPYSRAIAGTRAALPAPVLWSVALIFLLTLVVAKSTVTASWVEGMDSVPYIALAGLLVMGALAVSPIPWGLGVAIGLLIGPLVAAYAAGPALHASYPDDRLGVALIQTWIARIVDGTALVDQAFDLFLISWLMWVTGGWLAWCVLRWRQPMLGLIPGAAGFATNVLNFPLEQNGYVLMVLVLTLALLLWTNYSNSIASANRAKVKLTGDARWDFWESGLVAMAALIVLAIMLPPLSTEDRTSQMESSAFTRWAQFLQTLSHPTQQGRGPSVGGVTGFSSSVSLAGPLKRSKAIVFVYTITGGYSGPRYFRGLNQTTTSNGTWSYPLDNVAFKDRIAKGEAPQLAEVYAQQAISLFNVRMVSPPSDFTNILFYPGQLDHVDRPAVASEVILPPPSASNLLVTIDRLDTVLPPTSAGSYGVTVDYSIATAAQLQTAGTNYPAWVEPYMGFQDPGYRSPDVMLKIHNLAEDVVTRAGAKNPYEMAAAIEAYLRDSNNYRYTLSPPRTPPGRDRIDYFLFDSKQGFCEYFATAMGDMLRSLGIPTRLVNGYGPGSYEAQLNGYVVRSEDAHTWVESYFPGYGWITFEPTPQDGGYSSVNRGTSGVNVCARDEHCTIPFGPGGVIPSPTANPGGAGLQDPGNIPGGRGPVFGLRVPDAGTLTSILGVVVAIVLLVVAAVARYLRPRSVMGVWRRTMVLARLAGAERRPAETPFEATRRLTSYFPEARDQLRSLSQGFVVAAYAPDELAKSARASVLESWTALRPMLLRRLIQRFRRRDV